MSDLYIFDNKIETIFQLIGQKENDISYSVGYSFANCPKFLEFFLEHLKLATNYQPDKIRIKLQTHEKNKGFTDFEIIQEDTFHIIIEAKRGWNFPTRIQLKKYISRPSFKKTSAKTKLIVVFNESTPLYSKAHFKGSPIKSIPAIVISWHTIRNLASSSIKNSSNSERRLLKELIKYLDKISTMQKIDSNWVYVVSLGWKKPDKWKINWQDIVNISNKYFHPVGGGRGGWPAEPPTYIAFRYGGKLQSIHHVDNYEVFTDPSLHFPEIPKGNWEPHYLYHLGPKIASTKIVKSGKKIIRSMRVWAMLDLLLTCDTIQAARDKSRERENHIS
jgi:hypothetical protein